MREHQRDAVWLEPEAADWGEIPDWRFDRRVIRTAIYLKERPEIGPDDRVAIISGLSPGWMIADFATIGLNALPVALPESLPPDDLAGLLSEEAPRAAFVSSEALAALGSVRGGLSQIETWVLLDGDGGGEDAVPIETLWDLGGTLDTPERAQAWRAQAQSASPDTTAIRHYERAADGSLSATELSHVEIIERLTLDWHTRPARPGDRVYVTRGEVSLPLRLALYGFIGDGYSTVALGEAQRFATDLAELGPQKIIAPADWIEDTIQSGGSPDLSSGTERAGARGWMRRISRLTRAGREREARRLMQASLGGHARWIAPTTPLDPALSARLGSIVSIANSPAGTRDDAMSGVTTGSTA